MQRSSKSKISSYKWQCKYSTLKFNFFEGKETFWCLHNGLGKNIVLITKNSKIFFKFSVQTLRMSFPDKLAKTWNRSWPHLNWSMFSLQTNLQFNLFSLQIMF